MNKKIKIFAVVLLLNAGILSAQNEFQNTLPFDSSLVSPAATLQDVAWATGLVRLLEALPKKYGLRLWAGR